MFRDLPPRAEHGGLVKRCREKTGRAIIDFSASLNPFPPRIDPDGPHDLYDHYPDDTYTGLKERIGELFHRNPEEIAVGNGSIEIIRTFCQLIFRNGGAALVEPPTFGEYLLSSELAGGRRVTGSEYPKVHFICNPNNPTGELKKKDDIRRLLKKYSGTCTYLFLDEAFIELADPCQSLSGVRSRNLLILRSLTKSFSVPGIRFGYAFGEPDLITALETLRPPWSVNALAEQYALGAFSHYDELEESRKKIKVERDFLSEGLSDQGLQVMPSSANFILVDTGRSAAVLSRCLLEKDILVRDCTSFGLPRSIRIAVRNRAENRLLIEEIAGCLH
ncbi:MAG TPA: histidinol-phosphate transaminase [Methanoregulaceae archaeon]|nr:histidinol-phosphate transaminase [Methanoregulaceae archaeon]